MKIGDKVWTWNHWYNLIEIKIWSIQDYDRTDIVNGLFPLSYCSTTKEEARDKLLEHMCRQIEIKKQDIIHLEKEVQNIRKQILQTKH